MSDSTGLCSVCYGTRGIGERKLVPIESGPAGVRVCTRCDGGAFRVAMRNAEARERGAGE